MLTRSGAGLNVMNVRPTLTLTLTGMGLIYFIIRIIKEPGSLIVLVTESLFPEIFIRSWTIACPGGDPRKQSFCIFCHFYDLISSLVLLLGQGIVLLVLLHLLQEFRAELSEAFPVVGGGGDIESGARVQEVNLVLVQFPFNGSQGVGSYGEEVPSILILINNWVDSRDMEPVVIQLGFILEGGFVDTAVLAGLTVKWSLILGCLRVESVITGHGLTIIIITRAARVILQTPIMTGVKVGGVISDHTVYRLLNAGGRSVIVATIIIRIQSLFRI